MSLFAVFLAILPAACARPAPVSLADCSVAPINVTDARIESHAFNHSDRDVERVEAIVRTTGEDRAVHTGFYTFASPIRAGTGKRLLAIATARDFLSPPAGRVVSCRAYTVDFEDGTRWNRQ